MHFNRKPSSGFPLRGRSCNFSFEVLKIRTSSFIRRTYICTHRLSSEREKPFDISGGSIHVLSKSRRVATPYYLGPEVSHSDPVVADVDESIFCSRERSPPKRPVHCSQSFGKDFSLNAGLARFLPKELEILFQHVVRSNNFRRSWLVGRSCRYTGREKSLEVIQTDFRPSFFWKTGLWKSPEKDRETTASREATLFRRIWPQIPIPGGWQLFRADGMCFSPSICFLA